MLGLEDVQLKQTRFYQEAKEKGLEKGLQQGEKMILQRLLVRRFGELPLSVQQQLQQASAEQVERWADRLFDANTLDAIFTDANKL